MKRTCLTGILALGVTAAVAIAAAKADEVTPRKVPVRKDLLRRYGVDANEKRYAQDDPRQAIRSLVRAVTAGDVEYMLAHLIFPAQVDKKLKGDRQAFRKLVAKATPEKSKRMINALKRQLEQGTWTIGRDLAWAQTEGVPLLSLEKLGNRWFMHNVPVPLPKQQVSRRNANGSRRR